MIYYHMNHFNQMPVTPSTALTTHVMKCFEKCVISLLEKEIQPLLDTCQFAYKQNRGTEDAALSIVHLVSKHLENTKAYARILFVDFSSAFNTVQTHLLLEKLHSMGVSTLLIKWFHSFLSNRTQQVRVNGTLSEVRYSNTGVPQGCVSSPVLFSLYTNDCRNTLIIIS